MIVLLPLGILIGANFINSDSIMFMKIKDLILKSPEVYKTYNPSQLLVKLSLDFMFPAYFLIIPIMCSGIIGASSFVGEKEHKTLELLLYTPISMEQPLKAKVLGVFIPAYTITVVSFIVFGIIFNIGGYIYFGRIIFPDTRWLLIIFWISPIITVL